MRAEKILLAGLFVALWGCKDDELDASDQEAEQGAACAPEGSEEDGPRCVEGLACEPVHGGEGFVCGARLEIRGLVVDALGDFPIEGAIVAALDETGAPVSDVATTDADGFYVLPVSARRDETGEITDALKWTLFSAASDYQPFPHGIRPAIPVNALDSTTEEEDDAVLHVIENASTEVALIPLPAEDQNGTTVSGSIGGQDPGGTLVVAEGGARAPYTIADRSGFYTLFNVPTGVTIRGYRQGLEVEATAFSDGDVDLALVNEEFEELATVSGSINIVNAPGGSQSSVVLVPVSVYNEALERGPVPFGLRAPEPPGAPSIDSAFMIEGVPPGDYKVLAAFENDGLVRDPDESIAGTAIQEISVGSGARVQVDESFKVTEDIAVMSPGRDQPESVSAAPTFVWADDSSEDRYEIVIFDAFGEVVWEDTEVPRVTGGSEVRVEYGGPAMIPGMYYQFRATSMRDTNQGPTAISRTEDLRGVFVYAGS